MSCTAEQLSALLDCLEQHKDLARGLLRTADGRLRAKRLWQEITDILNALGGSVKTVPQWQKVWTDRKHLAKKNAAIHRRSASATGGGEGCPPLTSWEMKVLSIMGEGFGAPETSACVNIIPPMNFEDEVASYIRAPAEEQAGTSIPQNVEIVFGSELDGPPTSPHVDQHAGPSSAPQHADHPRSRLRSQTSRRQDSGNSGNWRARLIKIEEEKNDMLRGIKDGIQQLIVVLRELIELKKVTNANRN